MKALLNVESNLGYGADQVQGMTLGELLEAVQTAVDEWGEDTEVVLHQTNNRYGANYGTISQWDTFTAPEPDDFEVGDRVVLRDADVPAEGTVVELAAYASDGVRVVWDEECDDEDWIDPAGLARAK